MTVKLKSGAPASRVMKTVAKQQPTKKYGAYTKKQMQALLDHDMLHLVMKHDPTGPAFAPVHGAGGMFSEPGVRPDMYSAIPKPTTFLSALPILKSEYNNEVISILTGQSEMKGTNPDDVCGDPPTPGALYKCSINRRFGKCFVGSDVVDVTEIGGLANRADIERVILNDALSNPLIPRVLQNPGTNFRSEVAHQLWRVGHNFETALASIDVIGDNTNEGSGAEVGWLKEFDGLERIITNNIVDTSGAACPAADSLVETWGTTLGATVNGRRFGRLLHEMIYSRVQLANKLRLPGVQWALVMDERMFFEGTYELAAYYATVKLADASDAVPINRMIESIENRYVEMVNGQYWQIANLRMPVLFTSGAETTEGASTLTGDLFGVPLDRQGRPMTWLEYFPMDNAYINEFNGLTNTTNRQVLNDGLYMLASRSKGYCDQLMLAGKLRLMCDAPFLGFRLDNITYGSYVGFRSALPDSSSFYSGGTSSFSFIAQTNQ